MRTIKEVKTRLKCYEDLIDEYTGKIQGCEDWVKKRIKNQIAQLNWVLDS